MVKYVTVAADFCIVNAVDHYQIFKLISFLLVLLFFDFLFGCVWWTKLATLSVYKRTLTFPHHVYHVTSYVHGDDTGADDAVRAGV